MKKATALERLLREGFFETKESALPYLMSGAVYCGGVKVLNGGQKVDMALPMNVRGLNERYVGKGGYKLEGALADFGISAEGRVCIDAGACTGGFTDCLLQNGAKKVFAIDVGYGQLAWSIRTDPRVVCMERTNIRYVTPEQLGEPVQLAVIDVSFISLRIVLPAVKALLSENGQIVCLIKPQFEAGKENVGKKGVVRDPAVHKAILDGFLNLAAQMNMTVRNLTFSPVKGPEGNIEFLGHLSVLPEGEITPDTAVLVAAAHEKLNE